MNPKFETYVAVFFNHGGDIRTRYVTDIPSRNTAEWNAGKPAMKLAESYAKDIVLGLTLNGFAAAVVKVLRGVELSNP